MDYSDSFFPWFGLCFYILFLDFGRLGSNFLWFPPAASIPIEIFWHEFPVGAPLFMVTFLQNTQDFGGMDDTLSSQMQL